MAYSTSYFSLSSKREGRTISQQSRIDAAQKLNDPHSLAWHNDMIEMTQGDTGIQCQDKRAGHAKMALAVYLLVCDVDT